MEDAAIREGFDKLKPGTAYNALYEAALCRERADWNVGMNATRLFSCLYGQTLAVGCVMTPTLAMVVMRDAQIAAFKPEPFWTVLITAGGITASSPRFQKKEAADDLAALCREEGQAMIRTVETKEKLEKPPLLYDLTSLQRDANRILGFTAQQTLDYTQSLYEKKLVTYPRTDSRYLTDDMREMLPALIASVAGKFGYAGEAPRTEPVRSASVFDSSKVSDHHAIIPTKTMAGSDITGLSAGEKAVLQLISASLLCAAAEDHRYAEITVKLSSGAEKFTRKGKTVLVPGWKAIWQHFYPEKKKDEEANGPVPAEGTLVQVEHGEMDAGDFMSGIEGMIAILVTTYEKVKGADALMSRSKVIGTCPHCGAEVLERQKGWFCSNREFRFVLWKDNAYFTKIGKRLTPQIVEKLLRDGRVKLKDCKSQKTGKTYNADLLLSTEADGRPQFSMEFENRKRGGK